MRKLKYAMALVMSAAIMLTAAGCAGTSGNNSAGSTPAASTEDSTTAENQTAENQTAENQTAEEQPVKTGGTVRVAMGSEPDNLDPMLSAATDTGSVMMNVFEGLLGFDEKGEFIPAIAESYTISDDQLVYTFKLKKGILFHDGKDCTAKDVKYTYEKLAGLSGGEPLNSTLSQNLIKVETPDDYTVVLTLKTMDAGFLSKAAISIVEENYEDNSTQPIGTGPFKFVEYLQGQKIVLEKNENYSTREDRIPSIDKVEFKIMTDENARLMALKSGDLDIAGISTGNIAALGDSFDIVQGPQNMVQVMALNNSVEPLNNQKVRQAICYAVDKEEIIASVVQGSGTRVDSFLSPSMAAYYNDNLNVYDTDLEKAKALLTEAGYENGFDMTITVPSNYQTHVDTAQVIKNQLEKIGIHVEIELVEWAQWLENVYTNAQYEATIIGHSGKLDPQDFLNRFSSTYDKNYFKFSNKEYDELIAKAAATTNQSERAVLYKDCQQLLVDEAASVYIQDPNIVFAVSKKVSGLKIYPVTFFNMSDISVVE